MVPLLQATKKLCRCSGTLENHGSLLEDTVPTILFNLTGERYKMTILPLVSYPLPWLILSYGPDTARSSCFTYSQPPSASFRCSSTPPPSVA